MQGRDQPKLQCKNISSPQKLFVKIAKFAYFLSGPLVQSFPSSLRSIKVLLT